MYTQETQLSLGKADHTAYVRRPASDFQSQKESDFSEVTQFHERYVNETLPFKATINASVTHVTRGQLARRYEQLQS